MRYSAFTTPMIIFAMMLSFFGTTASAGILLSKSEFRACVNPGYNGDDSAPAYDFEKVSKTCLVPNGPVERFIASAYPVSKQIDKYQVAAQEALEQFRVANPELEQAPTFKVAGGYQPTTSVTTIHVEDGKVVATE